MASRVLFLVGVATAQVIGVPAGAICQAKLVPYTNSTPYAASNLYTNNATEDWNSFTLHLDTLQLWGDSWGGAVGALTKNPALDGLQYPASDDIDSMVSRIYVKDLVANTTYVTRVANYQTGTMTLAFRILSEPDANPMLLEYGVFGTWTKTRSGSSPVYDAGVSSTLARGKSCTWVNYAKI